MRTQGSLAKLAKLELSLTDALLLQAGVCLKPSDGAIAAGFRRTPAKSVIYPTAGQEVR